jgi:hypothetical protein
MGDNCGLLRAAGEKYGALKVMGVEFSFGEF